MSTPSVDPSGLGLADEQLSYFAEDGRYSVEIWHHEGSIYMVRERGYADDQAGRGLVKVFVRLLDALEERAPGAKLYLCADYSAYKGSSNATRKVMLREVVLRPSLGAVAFYGLGFVARSVAVLLNVALPRLAAKPFRSRDQALAFLEELSQEDARAQRSGAPVQPAPRPIPASHLPCWPPSSFATPKWWHTSLSAGESAASFGPRTGTGAIPTGWPSSAWPSWTKTSCW